MEGRELLLLKPMLSAFCLNSSANDVARRDVYEELGRLGSYPLFAKPLLKLFGVSLNLET
jgi:hypothetical protein